MQVDQRDRWVFLLVFAVFVVSAGDILSDLRHGAPLMHLLQEGAIMSLAAGVLFKLIVELRQQARELRALNQQMQAASAAAAKANPELEGMRKRLSAVVQRQFESWALSPSEREVGWLLLKGLSIKEIGLLRNTQEKTVRQQASAIYAKAQLPGRHAFAAWFLEDLL